MSISEKLTTIAENEQKVYDAGKQAEYDAFWDDFQQNGKKTDYRNSFGNRGWTQAIFKPKYDIRPANASNCFNLALGLIDIRKETIGVDIDTSNCTNLDNFLNAAQSMKYVGVIDTTNCKNLNNILYNMPELVSVEKLILKNDGSQGITNLITYDYELVDITIEGAIGVSIPINSCTKLSHDSLMSFINALYDYKGSGKTYTLTLGSTNLAKLTDAEKAVATEKGWTLA